MVGELFDVLQNTSLSEIYPVMGYIQKQREKQTPEEQKKGALKLREVLVGCNYQSYVTLLGESVMLRSGMIFYQNFATGAGF